MRTRISKPPARSKRGKTDLGDEPLSPAFVRELKRRIRESDDPTRYLIVSAFTDRFVLYYNVSSDHYVYKDPSLGTLFKQRGHAVAVAKTLGKHIQIIKVRLSKGGGIKRLSPLTPTYS